MKKLTLLVLLLTPIISFGLPSIQDIQKHGILTVPQIMQIYAKAKAGDAFSQANLGEGLINGSLGVLTNYSRGIYWLKKAAKNGSALGYLNLAMLYLQGNGVPINKKKFYQYSKRGLEIFTKKLAKKEYSKYQLAVVQYKLANMYYWGVPGLVKQNLSEAFGIYLASANDGFAHAIKKVTFMYRFGVGVKRNLPQAHIWAKLLANAGLPAAQYQAGIDYLHGIGTKKDVTKGLKWVRRAALSGHYPAIHELLKLNEMGVEKLSPATKHNLAVIMGNITDNMFNMLQREPLIKI